LREREREREMDERVMERESGRMGYGKREMRDLMFNMSGPKIDGVMERECLHAAHHYTLVGYKL